MLSGKSRPVIDAAPPAAREHRCPQALLSVSAAAGVLGPVIVLAGEADSLDSQGDGVAQLGEVLAAQVSARTRHLIIDASNLRSIDPATAQALMLAALIVMVQGGTIVLVNPQEPVLAMLSHTRTNEMFTIQRQTAGTTPDTGMDGESSEKGACPDDRSRARARVDTRTPARASQAWQHPAGQRHHHVRDHLPHVR